MLLKKSNYCLTEGSCHTSFSNTGHPIAKQNFKFINLSAYNLFITNQVPSLSGCTVYSGVLWINNAFIGGILQRYSGIAITIFGRLSVRIACEQRPTPWMLTWNLIYSTKPIYFTTADPLKHAPTVTRIFTPYVAIDLFYTTKIYHHWGLIDFNSYSHTLPPLAQQLPVHCTQSQTPCHLISLKGDC